MGPRTRTRKLRRLLGLAAAAALAVTAGSFALADSASVSFTIEPPAGSAVTGGVASFTPTDVTFARPQGQAQIEAGKMVGEIRVAAGYASSLRVDAAWLNPNDGGQVLNNPNASIWVGLYHPVYAGDCASGHANEVSDVRATMTFSGTDYCTALDTGATGTLVSDGKLVLSRELVSGMLRAAADDAGAAACTTSTASTSWCRPAGLDADENVLFVGATIVTPGGKPKGQQHNVSDLRFFFDVRSQA